MTTRMSSGFGGAEDSAEAADQAIREALYGLYGAPANVAFVYCTGALDPATVLGVARAQLGDVPIVGGSVAGGYTERSLGQAGVFVLLFHSDQARVTARLVRSLSQGDALSNIIRELPKDQSAPENLIFLLTDGLRNTGEETTLLISNLFGAEVTVAGGITAERSGTSSCVFFDDQIHSDAAVITLFGPTTPFFSAARHGHKPVSAPVTITHAVGTRVYTLNDRPAWSVWKELTREPARARGYDVDTLDIDNSLKYRIDFQLGLPTGAGRIKTRVITKVHEDGSFEIDSGFPSSARILVMFGGDREAQIGASRRAAEAVADAAKQAGHTNFAGAMVVECVVRQHLLGEELYRAPAAFKEVLGDIPLLAIASHGEMLLKPDDFSGYHNASTVVILFVDPTEAEEGSRSV